MQLAPLVDKQRHSYHRSTYPGNLWEGAVRSSKTVVSVLRWMQFIVEGPPGELAMIGKTERTLKRNVLDLMVAIAGPRFVKVSTGTGEVLVFGRRIYLVGANDEKAASKIQGMTLVGWYGDEVPTWPESVFSIARTRLSMPGAMWFGTGNPAAANHYLNKEFIKRAAYHVERDGSVIERNGSDAVEMAVFSFTLDDNPSLDPGFVRRLKREYAGVFYKRMILGEWCMAEGAIFGEWDASRNVMPREKLPTMREWLAVGVDYGTTNPFHAGLLGLGPDLDRPGESALYLTDEWRWDSRRRRRQLSDLEYSAHLRRWLADIRHPGALDVAGVQPDMVAVDPSAASFRVQLYRDGLPTVAAANDVEDSIRVANSLIAAGKLIVSADCPEVIEEIPGYVWDDKALKLGREEPLKVDDHGIDACIRYAPYTSRARWHHEVWSEAT